MQRMLEEKGVRIVRRAKLVEVVEDEDEGLEAVCFKMLDIPDEEEDEDELGGVEEKSE